MKSVDAGQNTYKVRLHSDLNPQLPSCECVHWIRHSLPCKHLLAVIMKCPDAGGWAGIPEFYRSFPVFTLDPDIAAEHSHADMTALSSPDSDHELHVEPDTTPVPSAETAVAAQSSVTVEDQPRTPTTSVEKLQSQLCQALAAMSTCTYVPTDMDFVQRTLECAMSTCSLQKIMLHCDGIIVS